MQKVTVCYFKRYNGKTDREVRSRRMATLEFINSDPNLEALEETAKEVDESELDEEYYDEEEEDE